MKLYEILIPVCDNETNKLDHQDYIDEVIRLTGGITVCSEVTGYWRNEDKLYKDVMIPIRVMCDFDTLIYLLDKAKKDFSQINMFYYEVSANAVIY